MKKIFSLLLIITFLSHSFIKASPQDALEDIKTETTSRNWQKQAIYFGTGLGVMAISYAIGNEDFSHCIGLAGTYLIASSAATIGRYCLEWYTEAITKDQLLSKKRHLKKKLSPDEIQLLEKTTKKNLQTPLIFLRQSQNLINAALKVGTLYISFQEFSTDHPLSYMIPPLSVLAGLVYNLSELRYTYKTGEIRNDIPIFKLIDGYCEAALAQRLLDVWIHRPEDQWTETAVKTFANGYTLFQVMPYTSSEWAFYRFLQIHGDVQAAAALVQMPFNIINGLKTYFTERPKIVEQIPQESIKPPSVARHKTHTSLSDTLPTEVNSPFEGYSEQPSKIENTQPKQRKVKRKGQLNPQPAVAAPSMAPEPLINTPSERDIRREEALARLQGLRKQTTIKVGVINEEITNLLTFLPKAYLDNIGHGKQAIISSFENGRSFRFIFEAPHAQNNAASSEYKGFGKTRVLDALQAGYLYGWNQDKILKFMDDNNITRFYNIPLYLIHILWDRGDNQ